MKIRYHTGHAIEIGQRNVIFKIYFVNFFAAMNVRNVIYLNFKHTEIHYIGFRSRTR